MTSIVRYGGGGGGSGGAGYGHGYGGAESFRIYLTRMEVEGTAEVVEISKAIMTSGFQVERGLGRTAAEFRFFDPHMILGRVPQLGEEIHIRSVSHGFAMSQTVTIFRGRITNCRTVFDDQWARYDFEALSLDDAGLNSAEMIQHLAGAVPPLLDPSPSMVINNYAEATAEIDVTTHSSAYGIIEPGRLIEPGPPRSRKAKTRPTIEVVAPPGRRRIQTEGLE